MIRFVPPPTPMTPMESRRAAELAALLEGGSRTGADPAAVALADLTTSFSRVVAPAPDVAFRSVLRDRLVDQAAAQLLASSGVPAPRPAAPAARAARAARSGVRHRGSAVRRQLAASGVALTLVVGTGVVVSNSALPGDDLYSLKRSVELVQLSIARGDHDRGVSLLDQANTRTREVQQLLNSEDAQDPGSVKRTGHALTEALHNLREGRALLLKAYAGGDTGAITPLERFLVTQRTLLDSLLPVVPSSLRPQLEALQDEIDAVAIEVREARDDCSTPCQPAPEPVTDAGPPAGVLSDSGSAAPVASVVVSDPDPAKADREVPPFAAGAATAAGAGTPSNASSSDAGRPNFSAPPPPGAGSVPASGGSAPAATVVPGSVIGTGVDAAADALPGPGAAPAAAASIAPDLPALPDVPVVVAVPTTSEIAPSASPAAPTPTAAATEETAPVHPLPEPTVPALPELPQPPVSQPVIGSSPGGADPSQLPDTAPGNSNGNANNGNDESLPAAAAHGTETAAQAGNGAAATTTSGGNHGRSISASISLAVPDPVPTNG